MVGDFVLLARVQVRKSGPRTKLVSCWRGVWRVVSDDRELVHTVQHLVSGDKRDAHVVRMQFYANNELEMSASRASGVVPC